MKVEAKLPRVIKEANGRGKKRRLKTRRKNILNIQYMLIGQYTYVICNISCKVKIHNERI